MRIAMTRFEYLVVFILAMNLLAFGNLFLAGNKLSTLWLMPVMFGSMIFTGAYLKNLAQAQRPTLSWLDLVALLYLTYSVLSVVLFIQPTNPASPSAYLYGLNLQVLPMLMYFTARGLSDDEVQRLIHLLVKLHVFFAVVGIALFFLRPDFYTEYLIDILGRSESWSIYARLQSFWGSTAAGILSAVTIVLLTNVRYSRPVRYLLLALFLFTVLLSQQRGAYVSGVLATAYFLYRERVRVSYLIAALAVLVGAFFYIIDYVGLTLDLLLKIVDNRIVGDLVQGDPFGERAIAYTKGLRFLTDFPLGLGLGATTSAANDAGAHVGGQVVDAYYMRIAADLGVPGLALFVLLLAVAAISALLGSRILGLAVIVLIYAFQSTGTNVLDSFYVAHVFWTLLGCMRNDRAAVTASAPAAVQAQP